MLQIQYFTFNLFQEHSYIIYNENLSAIIIDPGFQHKKEEDIFINFINQKGLKPVFLINTHCHIDHVLGNEKIYALYKTPLHVHSKEKIVLEYCPQAAAMFDIDYKPYSGDLVFLKEPNTIQLDEDVLDILELPGHSPGSLGLYCKQQSFIISGDVLFNGSIGRTDLPLGNYETLLSSIKNKFLHLPDNTHIYAGHGKPTNIKDEKKYNPFLQ